MSDVGWLKMNIFTRIIIGYLAIFIPVAAVSAYAFSQLALFRGTTDDILQMDNRLKDLVQKIADSILAQTRYERKYIITGDEELVRQFMLAEGDVRLHLDEAISLAGDGHVKTGLIRIRQAYEHYESIFNEEVEWMKKAQPYFQAKYREEKEKTVDEILLALRNLKLHVEQDTYDRIKRLDIAVVRTNQVAVGWATGFILMGIIISVFITRSITRPLAVMRKKTRRVAGGDFKGGLELSSPPEIRDLAQDFNLMCGKIKAMDDLKSDFFSLMAHELRTPLASIREGTNLLMHHIGDDLKDQKKEVLSIIAEESNRLTDLVNSLLDLSKLEAGMIKLNLERTNMDKLIHQAVFGIRPLAMTTNVRIEIAMAPDLPEIRVDAERILQALRNLIGNAVKFTPAGGLITISAQSDRGRVKVSVADTGPGIAPGDLQLIFDKFKQGAMTDHNTIKGTGLGLAIVKHIISAHGGKIWVASEIGRGSTFTFFLPE